ncbi:MAG TPA: hypothetical protein VMF31_04470 [Solirubrobacterales bacterium]|nr:hypothetical protein [Solirubrobacterales bacterium]
MVLALGGTATALSGKFSVKRDDIAPKAVSNSKLAGKAVTSGKIKDGNVGSYKLRLNGSTAVLGESSTTSQTPVDLGGPSVSVKVPEGAMLAIQAEAAIRATGNAQGRVYLTEPSLVPTPARVLSSGATADFQTKYSTPGSTASGADDGVASKVRAGWIVMPSTPSTKTFSLRYDTTGGTAIFKERRLTVTVIR